MTPTRSRTARAHGIVHLLGATIVATSCESSAVRTERPLAEARRVGSLAVATIEPGVALKEVVDLKPFAGRELESAKAAATDAARSAPIEGPHGVVTLRSYLDSSGGEPSRSRWFWEAVPSPGEKVLHASLEKVITKNTTELIVQDQFGNGVSISLRDGRVMSMKTQGRPAT
jgi:hypothetical protein